MDEHEWLAEQFEANRTHLRAVAYRMLGDLTEADDAVQESWLHLSSSDTSGVKNLGGWLTTVVARICLDMLRSRKSRREESLEASVPEPITSRARHRVRGGSRVQDADLTYQREVVDAFLTASRAGNFDALLAVLDPEVVFRHDRTAVPVGASREVYGAPAVAKQFAGRAQGARTVLVNGSVGVVVAPYGRLLLVLGLTITHGKIAEINVISDPARLRQLHLSVLGD
jgi:DNA-directed RNA polymerase specialized sigma24 family protein